MNIASAELLQNSLQNLGNTFQRNRQMDLENAYRQAQMQAENRRADVDQAFRDAQMQHYLNLESRQADAAQAVQDHNQRMEQDFGVQQAMQKQAEAKQDVVDGLQEMSLSNKYSDAQKTNYFKSTLDGLDPAAKATVLQNPAYNAIYQGDGDWDAIRQSVLLHRAGGAASPTVAGQQAGVGAGGGSGPGGTPAPVQPLQPAVQVPGAAPANVTPPASTNVPTIHTQDDYNALPFGAQYRDSSGTNAVKGLRQPGQ
jgi:hypothetical protein